MKKNNKGFTLIELLVVVAIIGILAAVGVVAYSGYTSSAKKSSAKSNHATVLKYVAAEVQKCNIGETAAMKNSSGVNQLTCSDRKTAGKVSEAATAALAEFKNPYGTVGSSTLAIFDAAAFAAATTACTISTEGRTNVKSTTTQVTVSTCVASGELPLQNTSLIE
jgi:type IV pilus assembly protein PilA